LRLSGNDATMRIIRLSGSFSMVRRYAPLLVVYVVAAMVGGVTQAFAADIIQEWNEAKAPPAPAVKDATVKAATTAFLILDIEQRTCNEQARPRCIAEVPAMAAFAKKARDAKMLVAYSNTGGGSPETIAAPLKPQAGEHVVKGSVNKFYGTDLESFLKGKKIDTVVVCATTAYGATLFSATAAAQAGFNVIVPVDCNPGSSQYEEQLTVYTLATAPGSAAKTTITRLASIKIE
jgi:nicotinamidase-related amidase